MALWSLAEVTSSCSVSELNLEAECPGLLLALEEAARHHAPALSVQAR